MPIKKRKIHNKRNLKSSAKKLNLLPILLGILFISLFLLYQTVFLKKQKAGINVLNLSKNGISLKKGVGGAEAFKGALNRASDLRISWFYNWAYIPFWGNDPINWSKDVWENPNLEFVPLWSQKKYLTSLGISSCNSAENQKKLFDAIVQKISIICSYGYCNQNPGRYHLIGNEPDQGGTDSDGIDRSTDFPGDAAACYGTIIRAIKSKDSTAKFIMLALSKEDRWDNYRFLNSFFAKWKQIWAGTEIYNLPTMVKGWSLHTYYGNPNNCPTDDSRANNYLNNINGLLTSYFGQTVPNQELWITEMGTLWGIPGANTPERAKIINLMQCLINVYEKSPLITRYAWFYLAGDAKWNGISLYNRDPGNYCVQPTVGGYCLTDLGLKYSSIPETVETISIPTLTIQLNPSVTSRPTTLVPTATIRPSNTITPIPSIIPTISSETSTVGKAAIASHLPQILALANFPNGSVNNDYSYTFEGIDLNPSEELNIRMYGIPPGLRQDNCSQGVSNQKRYIRCQLIGKPTSSGKFYGYIKLSDLDNTVTKNVRIIIN